MEKPYVVYDPDSVEESLGRALVMPVEGNFIATYHIGGIYKSSKHSDYASAHTQVLKYIDEFDLYVCGTKTILFPTSNGLVIGQKSVNDIYDLDEVKELHKRLGKYLEKIDDLRD